MVTSIRDNFKTSSRLNEHGIPRAVCASILGADTSIIDAYYVHIGEQAQEKAIMAISDNHHTISDSGKIKRALTLIESCQDKPAIVLELEKILK